MGWSLSLKDTGTEENSQGNELCKRLFVGAQKVCEKFFEAQRNFLRILS